MARVPAQRRAVLPILAALWMLGTSRPVVGIVVRFDGSSGARITIEPAAELSDVVVVRVDPVTGEKVGGEAWRISGQGMVSSLNYGVVPEGFTEPAAAAPLEPGWIYGVTLHASDAEYRRTLRLSRGVRFLVTRGGLIIGCDADGSDQDDPRCEPVRRLYRSDDAGWKNIPLGLPAPLEGK